MTDDSVVAHVIPRFVLLHAKFNFGISTTSATAIVHNRCHLHTGEYYDPDGPLIIIHRHSFIKPCNAEPARAKVDELRIMRIQPSLRWVKFLPIPNKLWLGVHEREVSCSQGPGLGCRTHRAHQSAPTIGERRRWHRDPSTVGERSLIRPC